MPYKPGQSGNLNGRPVGRTIGARLRESIEQCSDEILQTVIAACLGGDQQACKILLDKVLPSLKPCSLPVSVPFADNLSEQGNLILKSTLTGEIAPEVGSGLLSALSTQTKLIEFDELVKRVELLEQKNA